MDHLTTLEDKLASLPFQPGIYLMKDAEGAVLYVGKAKSLRHRVRSYFQAGADQSIKTRILVSKIKDVDYIVTATEKEALILESNLIKQHKPRYNIILKDDKHYPYLKLTVQEDYPRLMIARRAEKDGALYFGPFSSAYAARETLEILHRLFPIRKCMNRTCCNRTRPCINFQLKRCLAPCCFSVDREEYGEMVKKILLFLRGHDRELVAQLNAEMDAEAKNLNFEKAAAIRDQLVAIERTLEKQKIVSTRFVDQDIISFFRQDPLLEVYVLFVRQGRVLGNQAFFFHQVTIGDEEVISSFLTQFYRNGRYIPDEVIIPLRLETQDALEEYLREKKEKRVSILSPRGGDRKSLLAMATENARLHLESRQSEAEKIHHTLSRMAAHLRLRQEPRAIECVDISNLFGAQAVGSIVRFENGEPAKEKYRHYRIKSVDHADDYGMMCEVLKRRLMRGLEEQDLPSLLVVDGGKGQLHVACEVMKELGITSVDAIGLAKSRFQDAKRGPEKVFLPQHKSPLLLIRQHAILHLLQRIRDESHRFALTYHRTLRQKDQIRSLLDDVPGIGPIKKKNLLTRFRSLKRIQAAGEEELASVASISRTDAKNIVAFFQQQR
jgi:excinuclease ABC subunit C